MRASVSKICVIVAVLVPGWGHAEDNLPDLLSQPGADLSDPAFRSTVVARLTAAGNRRRESARGRAGAMGLPTRVVRSNGRVEELADFRDDGRPLYFTTHNANASISTGASLLQTSPYTLSGNGVVIGEWDGGSVRSTHQEFGSRITIVDNVGNADHSTHVAGIMIAAGVSPSAHGMAASATVRSYDWTNDTTEMTAIGASAANQAGKIYLSNHSYGYISGWNYVNGGSPYRLWEWNGNGSTSTSFEQDFGRYNTNASGIDSLTYSLPYYLVFQSAGNDRADNPSAGQAVALSSGSSTVVSYDSATYPPGDGVYHGGFETVGFNEVAKNVLTVGSVGDAVSGGVRNLSNAYMSSYSCWGPTDDGRIKPDVVANGESLYSTMASSDSIYGYMSGTSMASPNACGSAALLIEQYSSLFPGQAMRASTLKGLLIHTADDLGNAGPDYKFGWGLVNVKAAADLIIDQHGNAAKQRISENQLTTATTSRTHNFIWDGVSPITATLSWTDPAGAATSTSDSRTARLVNNLNLKIVAPGGSEYLPFVMPFVGTWTESSMDQPATTGVNNTDNVEQVKIAAPTTAGVYQAVVSFTGNLTNSSQYYSLILSGTSADPLASTSAVSPAPGGATNYGSSASFTASVTGSGAAPTGSVSFYDGATWIGTSALDGSGQAVFSTSSLSLGVHSITVSYGGDLSYSSSASSAVTHVVNPKPVTISGISVGQKIYDGSTSVSLSGGTVDGVVSGESVTVIQGSGIFASANAGTQNVVTSGYAIGGTHAGNYTLAAQPVVTGTIAPRPIILSGTKTYDGTNAAYSGVLTVSNNIDGANLTLAGAAELTGRNTGPQPLSGGLQASRIQSAVGNTGNTAASTFGVTLGSAPVSGNTLIAVIATRGSVSNIVSSITQTGATWTRAAQAVRTSMTTEIWYASGVSAAGTAVTINQSSVKSAAVVIEYSGLLVPGPLDQTAAATGSGTTISTGTTATTVQANELWLGGIGITSSSTTVGSITGGFATIASSTTNGATNAKAYALEKIVSATGGAASGGTASGSVSWAGVMTTFRTAQSGTLVLSGSAAGNYTTMGMTGSVTIVPKILSIGGFSVADKEYDGTASANLSAAPALALAEAPGAGSTLDGKPYEGDDVSVGGTPNATFSDKHSGSAKPVVLTGVSLGGAQAANYAFELPEGLSGTITKRETTITAMQAMKVYDGTTDCPGTPAVSPALAAGDVMTSLYQSFTSEIAASGNKEIVPHFTINDGNGGMNYQVHAVNNLTGTITPAEATVVLSGLQQEYDGNPKPVTAITAPAGLPVAITYDGSANVPLAAGIYQVLAAVTDPNYQGSAAGSLVIAADNDWSSWQTENFTVQETQAGLAGDHEDPDGDGFTNLAEYALGTDPHQFTPPPVVVRDSSGLTLTFNRPANLPDVTYAAEASDDLITWTPVSIEVIATGAVETVRARDPLASGDLSKRVMRLKFTRP